MRDIIRNILAENAEAKPFRNLISRESGLSIGLDKIQAIIGPRRVGKTSLLWLVMDNLKNEQKVSGEKILYFNFEDERIQFTPTTLDLILQAWQELHSGIELSDMWFFFDEIQAAPGWEKFLNRINENYTGRIVFTGSNSSILHTQIKSVMRGRSIAVEVLPLSFKEYCHFRGIEPVIYGKGRATTLSAFYDYLKKGGYPETVNLKEDYLHTAFLQEYYNAMLLRDIVEYNQISNYNYLRELYRNVANSIGQRISIRRLFNQLKSLGYQVGSASVYDAMDYAEQAYLFKRIGRFDYSEIKRAGSDKKIYWIDNGLLNANTVKFSDNNGLLFENAIFWALYKQFGNIYNPNLYYFSDQSSECDFVVYKEGGEPLPVQVCWSLDDPDTRRRELKGLLNACRFCEVKNGWIITADKEEEFAEDEVNVKVIAGWKWMLQSGN